MPLRGRRKFDKRGNIYFITSSLFHHERIFLLAEKYCYIIIDSLKYLVAKKRASLYVYVIMPTHIHLLLHLPVGESIVDFMRDFKRFTAMEIKEKLIEDNYTIVLERLKGYALGYNKQNYKIWMDRYDDVIVTTERVFKIKMDYIHFNPVKAGLVKEMVDWKFSSYRNYMYDDNSIIEVKTDLSFKE
jgi:REP element-mobilizing transposase RayT